MPLSTFATLQTSTEPRELKRFQQLNAVRIQGVDPAAHLARPGPHLPGERGAHAAAPGLHHRLRGRVAPAPHRGQPLPGHLPAFRRSSSTWCSRRSSRASATHSSSWPGPCRSPSRARCSSRSSASPPSTSIARSDSSRSSGLVSKNGILIVEFANHLQETGKDKLAAILEAASTRLRPILMTTAATVVGHFPLVLATGPGRRRPQQHRHHAGERHDHRHGVHAVRGAVDLRAGGPDADRRRARRRRRRRAAAPDLGEAEAA